MEWESREDYLEYLMEENGWSYEETDQWLKTEEEDARYEEGACRAKAIEEDQYVQYGGYPGRKVEIN